MIDKTTVLKADPTTPDSAFTAAEDFFMRVEVFAECHGRLPELAGDEPTDCLLAYALVQIEAGRMAFWNPSVCEREDNPDGPIPFSGFHASDAFEAYCRDQLHKQDFYAEHRDQLRNMVMHAGYIYSVQVAPQMEAARMLAKRDAHIRERLKSAA